MYFPPILPIKSIPNWLKSISSQEIHNYQIVLTCIVCHTFVRNTTHKNEFKRFFLFYEKSIFCRLETEEGESSNCNATKVVLSRKKNPGPLIINTRPPFPSPKTQEGDLRPLNIKHRYALVTWFYFSFMPSGEHWFH